VTPQRANILLSGCLGICLLALGFLLGRESNRAPATVISAPAAGVAAAEPLPPAAPSLAPTTAPSASPTLASPAAAPPEATPLVVASRTSSNRVSSSLRTRPTTTPPTSTSPTSSNISYLRSSRTGTSPEAADDPDKQAVAHYFREVDRLQDVDVDNPEAAATSLIGAATSGDTSGLRALVSQARDAEQKVRAVTPPPPCAHYHEQLVSMLAESRSMLQRLEQGIGGGDPGSLSALISQANSAKSRSAALASEARELKRRYGIAP